MLTGAKGQDMAMLGIRGGFGLTELASCLNQFFCATRQDVDSLASRSLSCQLKALGSTLHENRDPCHFHDWDLLVLLLR